jgi:eukaryotic-like serine/threonine-protein kinase
MNLNKMNKELPGGSTLSHYSIVSKIGVGGMGEVYLAQDTNLDRKVALKVLPADLAANQDRMRRFVQEAKAAAALNHPNIAHIYEIGESDGTNFIAMEFVEGVTLREKIHRERTELRKLLRYLQHVAEGLAKAHAAGIVHRDLKPDNIMITHDGHAKILDFGLAKLIEPQQPGIDSGSISEDATAILQQHSTPGMIMGTVGYMSPEQAQGKTNEIDQRSDIFSFGCILYEAVTGQQAFAGKDLVDSLNKIIREPVVPVSDFRPDAPNHLQRIVRRCLAKDPEDRYQTIKDAAIELRDLRHELAADGKLDITVTPATVSNATGGPVTRAVGSQSAGDSTTSWQPSMPSRASSVEYIVSGFKRHKLAVVIALLVLVVGAVSLGLYLRAPSAQVSIESIAVMPFVNESGNADVEYLSDGMTETLINSLSQIPNVSVKARSSVFRYKGKEIYPKKVASELGVQAILTGRVIQRGDELTLSVELIDGQTENTIWGNKYERKGSDLVALQSEVARDVSNKLKSKLSGADVAKVERSYTTNPEAYQLYLKGRFLWNKRTIASLEQAAEFYKQAIEKDPNYPLAYAGLAETYALFSIWNVAMPKDSMPQAKAAALRALELDDSLAEPHVALGEYLIYYEWDRSGGEKEFRRAIELNPNYATAHQWLGSEALAPIKRFDEAIAELRRAEELDPLSPIIGTRLGDTLLFAHRYDEVIAQYERTLSFDPNFAYAHQQLGWAYGVKGMYPEAIAEERHSLELNPDPTGKGYLALWLARSGERREAMKLLDQLKQESTERYVQSYAFALVHIGLDEKEEAFNWLEKDISDRSPTARVYGIVPELDGLRSDPRFKEMLKRLNLPE